MSNQASEPGPSQFSQGCRVLGFRVCGRLGAKTDPRSSALDVERREEKHHLGAVAPNGRNVEHAVAELDEGATHDGDVELRDVSGECQMVEC